MDIDDYLNLQSHSDGSTFDLQEILLSNQDNNSDIISAPLENSSRLPTTTTSTTTTTAATATTTTTADLTPHDTMLSSYPLSSTTSSSTCWNDDAGLVSSENDNTNRLFDKSALPSDVEQFLYTFGDHSGLLSSAPNWTMLAHDQQGLSTMSSAPLTDHTSRPIPSCLPDFLAPQFLTLTTPNPQESLSTTEPQGMVTRAKRQRSSVEAGVAKQVSPPPAPPTKKKRGKKLYCVCQQPYDGQPMVQCDGCKQWFHCSCVNLNADEMENVDWICDQCKSEDSPMDESNQPTTTHQYKPKTLTRNTRHQHTCLLATCNNHTRADSYCSDICARLDMAENSGGVSSRPKSKKRSKSFSTTHLDTESTTSETSDDLETTTVKIVTTPSTATDPEPVKTIDPIRKNVLKSLTTTLTPILTRATDELPEALAVQVANDPLEAAESLATQIEGAIFDHLGDENVSSDNKQGGKQCGDRYKIKVRSLLYNLRDKANQEFQRRVVTGDMSTEALALMSSEDMANPELKSMSESLREKSIKNSVLKIETMPIIKKTHKGDIIMIPKKDNKDSSSTTKSFLKLTTTSNKDDPVSTSNKKATYSPTTTSSTSSPVSTSTVSGTPLIPPVVTKETMDAIWKQIGITKNSEGTQQANDTNSNKKKKPSVDLEALLGEEDEGDTLYAVDEDEDESCWNGRVDMPEVASFDAKARQIGGRTLTQQEWRDILPTDFFVEGRIRMDSADKYVSSMEQSTSRDVVLLEVECQSSTASNDRHMQTLLNYFECRKRYGVVGHDKTKIKDFYLWPLYKSQPMPHALRAVVMNEKQQQPREGDMFLGVLVISKPNPQQGGHQHKHRPRPPSLPTQQQQQSYQNQPSSLPYQSQRYQAQQKPSAPIPQLGTDQSHYNPSYYPS
ncbi:transcription factor S-II, central domain-containing protein [Chlamydoabsidia padenii]|nr:transcription factor S-II, central domain-containing protein [Chlamydoabsidia padenii]